MRILLIGSRGQLGWELHRTLLPLGEVLALDYPEIDLGNSDSIQKRVLNFHPQLIVNAAGYTAVDRAESEPEAAMAINGRGPGVLAEVAKTLGSVLIHFSTDYVFDGQKNSPYLETDEPHPINTYGRSKLAGEQAITQVDDSYIILRTSWMYNLRSENFVTKVLNWARQSRVLRVVTDQISNPTWARMLAEITAQMIALGRGEVVSWLVERRGLYHLAGDGYTSRFEWAQAILRFDPRREEQIVQEIQPALTAEFQTPARRPLNSALQCDLFQRTFGLCLPSWEYALELAMQGGVYGS